MLAQLRSANSTLVADGQLVAALGAAAGQDGASILCFHTLTKSVSFGALAIVGLKRSFWHVGES
jgi:hypothetical protein